MKRRNLLARVCAGCVGTVTGCIAEDSNEPENSVPSGTQSGDGVVIDIEMPDEAAVGGDFDVAITAENFEITERMLSLDVQITMPRRETEIVEIDLQIPPGTTESESITVSSRELGTVVATIGAHDVMQSTDIVPLDLTFGEYVDAETMPQITLLKPEVSRSYRRELAGDVVEKDATAGNQFVFVELRVRNPDQSTTGFPDSTSFVARIGDREYEPMSTDLSSTNKFVEPVVGKELDVFSPRNAVSEQHRTPQYESRIVPFEVRSAEISDGIEIYVEWSLNPTAGETAVQWRP